jgi:hypothetical protein
MKALGVRGIEYRRMEGTVVADSVKYIVQNPEKSSDGARAARKGHFVVCVYRHGKGWCGVIIDGTWYPKGTKIPSSLM